LRSAILTEEKALDILGDGNRRFVNNEDILGSMEFACKVAGSKLGSVLGHTKCGAVKGACDNVQMGSPRNRSPCSTRAPRPALPPDHTPSD
jgi:carbonic anhydrase